MSNRFRLKRIYSRRLDGGITRASNGPVRCWKPWDTELSIRMWGRTFAIQSFISASRKVLWCWVSLKNNRRNRIRWLEFRVGFERRIADQRVSSIMRTPSAILATVGLFVFATALTLADGPTTAPTTAPASSVAGTWTYTLRIEDLQVDATAELKQDGSTVTGTVIAGADKKALDVRDGDMTGSEVRFTVDRTEEVGTLRTTYRGTVDGDRIRGTVEFGWVDDPNHPGISKVDWVAARVKDPTNPPQGIH